MPDEDPVAWLPDVYVRFSSLTGDARRRGIILPHVPARGDVIQFRDGTAVEVQRIRWVEDTDSPRVSPVAEVRTVPAGVDDMARAAVSDA